MSDQEQTTENLDPPTTTAQEYENGIFSMVIGLCRWYQSQGMSSSDAANSVASLLDTYADGLRRYPGTDQQVNNIGKETE